MWAKMEEVRSRFVVLQVVNASLRGFGSVHAGFVLPHSQPISVSCFYALQWIRNGSCQIQ